MKKITNIETCKRNKERVNIYIDNNFEFAMDAELLYKLKLEIGSEITEDTIEEIIKKDGMSKCKDCGLRIIERSYKTEKELIKKLQDKEFNENEIEFTIDFLKKYNFLDDYKYAKMYAKDKIFSKGKNKIKYELMRKGIDAYILEEILEELDTDVEFERAMVLGEKKYNLLKKTEGDPYKLNNKLFRYLVGRGYDFETAKKVINKIKED